MPIFQYKCKECNHNYEIFFKVREDIQLIICPNCASTNYKKLISSTNISTRGFSNNAPVCSNSCQCQHHNTCQFGQCEV